MEEPKLKLAFWLTPAPDAKRFFASVVVELARDHGAPVFEPHVTLQAVELGEQRALQLLENAAANHDSLELQIDGIRDSEKYTKTLYVQFQPSAQARAISDAIAAGSGSGGSYEFDPHLSLIYKTMPEAEKEALARGIKIPFERVAFDSIKLVNVPAAIKGPEDVHAWRTIAERPLARSFR